MSSDGSAVLPNGGTADAADCPSTRSSRDHAGLRTEVRGASAIPRISDTGTALADATNDLWFRFAL